MKDTNENNKEIIIKLIRSNRRLILNRKQIKFSDSLQYADYAVDMFGWGDKKHKKEAYQLAAVILGKVYTITEGKYYRIFAEKYLLPLPKSDVILKFNRAELRKILQ
ncbi:hypothetical protein JW766_03885 [Candidatus Dojkabacteria bacterium]|nr:hypothetical protein [Candidatus Dojkabacteria bacterium]